MISQINTILDCSQKVFFVENSKNMFCIFLNIVLSSAPKRNLWLFNSFFTCLLKRCFKIHGMIVSYFFYYWHLCFLFNPVVDILFSNFPLINWCWFFCFLPSLSKLCLPENDSSSKLLWTAAYCSSVCFATPLGIWRVESGSWSFRVEVLRKTHPQYYEDWVLDDKTIKFELDFSPP